MSSVNPDDFAHLKIPLEKILSATNNFSHENHFHPWGHYREFYGQLSWSGDMIDIYRQKLRYRNEEVFWNEVSLLSSLKHKNLVSFVGFCDENDEKIIITRRETRGYLDSYLRDPMMLTWVRRLEISVGIAQALSYIYYDESRDFSVIHRNIGCHSIQLNDDWEPKLSDFELSWKIKASERNDYSENHKSDMRSFGLVLIQLLCGKISEDYNPLAPQFITHYEEKKLEKLIYRDLWVQMDLHSFKMFAEIAYECLDKKLSRRPNIDGIVPRLEKALKLAREIWQVIENDALETRRLGKCMAVVAGFGFNSDDLKLGPDFYFFMG